MLFYILFFWFNNNTSKQCVEKVKQTIPEKPENVLNTHLLI